MLGPGPGAFTSARSRDTAFGPSNPSVRSNGIDEALSARALAEYRAFKASRQQKQLRKERETGTMALEMF